MSMYPIFKLVLRVVNGVFLSRNPLQGALLLNFCPFLLIRKWSFSKYSLRKSTLLEMLYIRKVLTKYFLFKKWSPICSTLWRCSHDCVAPSNCSPESALRKALNRYLRLHKVALLLGNSIKAGKIFYTDLVHHYLDHICSDDLILFDKFLKYNYLV